MTREEAIKKLEVLTIMPWNIPELLEALDMAIEALQADRPHGEWIETTSGTICSNCGEYPYDDGEYHIANWHSNFCPSCGADMRQKK